MPSHDLTSPSPEAARRSAQPDLPFLEAYFANVVALSEDAIISVNPDQQIRMFNQGAETIFGYTEGEMLGQHFAVLLPERFRAVHQSHMARFAPSDDRMRPMNSRQTIFGLRKDGTEFPAEATITQFTVNGETVLTVRLRDMTEARHGVQARGRLAAIVESSDDAIISKSLEGIITSWNPAADRLFGYTAVEAVGQPITIIIPPERLAEEDAVLAHIRRGEGVDHFETVRVTKAGQRIDISLTVSPVKDAEGRIIGASKIARDITERKRAEAALDRAHDELEGRVVERTAALTTTVQELKTEIQRRTAAEDQLRKLSIELTLTEQREHQRLAQVLHDGLQQLLVAAQFRTTLLERLPDPRVQAGARELRDLLQEALTASRSLTAELSPPVLQTGGLIPALEWLAQWMAETHQLVVDLHAETNQQPESDALKILLFQAIRELLFNVVKHTGVRQARVEITQSDGHMRVVVADEGQGFDPDQRQAASMGGLGLPSIRQRLEFVGGRLEVASRPGQGSRFTLSVPLHLSA